MQNNLLGKKRARSYVSFWVIGFLFIQGSAFSLWSLPAPKAALLLRQECQQKLASISRASILLSATTDNNQQQEDGVRLNKAFKATHSRREADRLITEGRIRVNGVAPDTMGVRLFVGDTVTLDGKKVHWERLNLEQKTEPTTRQKSNGAAAATAAPKTTTKSAQSPSKGGVHTYIKYWKPRGIECTTNRSVRHNIMDALGDIPGVTDRLWPMGRLDKESTGLIIITSDGPTTQRVLKSDAQKWKTYLVETDRRAMDEHLETLSQGVRIPSHTSRDGNTKVTWITTQPSVVARGPQSQTYRKQLLFQICEGKNRQIRRMCETVGLTVVRLHRVEFAGITLDGCPSPGSWTFLKDEELGLLKNFC
jgi:23S rRNA pseudouridine2604 synthase